MKIFAAILLLLISSGYPLSRAVSEETEKPEGQNTLGEGYKAVKDAKAANEVEGSNKEVTDAETEGDSNTEPGSQAQGINEAASPGGPAQAKENKGLPRGDSLRSAEKPRYDSTGMRDPFKPYIKLVDVPTGPPAIVRPPIQMYPLNRFRLAGIIWIGDEPKAMIVDPEANTYFLGVGDKIGNKNGEIMEVRGSGILVQESTRLENVYGEEKIEVTKSVLAFQSEE